LFPRADAAPDSSFNPPRDVGPSQDGETSPVTDTGADTSVDGPDASLDVGADVSIDTGIDVSMDIGPDVSMDGGDGAPPRGVEFVAPDNDTVFRARESGELFEDACDDGEALIGLRGTYATSNWFAQVGGVCGRLSVSCSGTTCDVLIDRTKNLPLSGARETSRTWESLCPSDHLVTGFRGSAGDNIDMLGLRCSPLEITVDGDDHSLHFGAHTDVELIGNPGGRVFPQTDCLTGTAATNTRIYALSNYDDPVSSLSLRCQTPLLVY
jgi:hypothetical protein